MPGVSMRARFHIYNQDAGRTGRQTNDERSRIQRGSCMRVQRVGALIIGILAFIGVKQPTASAGFMDWVCDALKIGTAPLYYQLKAAVVLAKDAGQINSLDECLQLGDVINDFMIPTGAYKDCVCHDISWPPAQPPACAVPHDACTQGSAIPAGMPTPAGCQPGLDFALAEAVCRTDPFCCQTLWDSICVGEVSHAAWTNEQRYLSDLPSGSFSADVFLSMAKMSFANEIATRSCISPTPN